MATTQEESDAALNILATIYGPWIKEHGKPTDKTIQLTEELLLRVAECKPKVRLFLSLHSCSIPPVAVASGTWLRKCIIAIAKGVSSNRDEFRGCDNFGAVGYKFRILDSFQ